MFMLQEKANPEVCRAVLRIDDYVNIHTLVTYYQMVSNLDFGDVKRELVGRGRIGSE